MASRKVENWDDKQRHSRYNAFLLSSMELNASFETHALLHGSQTKQHTSHEYLDQVQIKGRQILLRLLLLFFLLWSRRI
eukprot:4914805-Amphidinium_carterae.2